MELERALPALREAEEALNVLTKKDISELKVRCACDKRCSPGIMGSFRAPPCMPRTLLYRCYYLFSPLVKLRTALVELTLGGVMHVLRKGASHQTSTHSHSQLHSTGVLQAACAG